MNDETISLYKFRSSSQFGYAMDIIFNRRLHCSPWYKMNDIQEGWGLPDYDKFASGRVSYDELYEYRKQLLVCSLSGTCLSHLLWAHYANGFNGLAIEVVVPSEYAVPVRYLTDINDGFSETDDPAELAKESLRNKLKCWKYEEEFRIIQTGEWFENIQIKSVIVGSRMDNALFKILYSICAMRDIPVSDSRFSSVGIEVGRVDENRIPIG